jgi:hypothetical protein
MMTAAFTAGLLSPALAIDLDLGVGAKVGTESSKAGEEGWTVRVCKPATEADQVKIEVGAPDGKDRQTLATWNRSSAGDDVEVYEVPKQLADRGKIWVRGTAKPERHAAYMGVFHGDEAKKVFEFKGHQGGNIGVSDPAAAFRCPKT